MIQEISNQKKLELLMPWFASIIESVKKDLKQEHLQNDRQFLRTYFGNKPIPRITVQELIEVYQKMVESGIDNVCEFIIVRWVLKHTDLYHYFEKELSKINPDFDQLKTLEEDKSKILMDHAVHEFGAIQTYIFTILNTVVFQEHHIKELREHAIKELSRHAQQAEELQAKASLEELKVQHETAIQRITDKYEKKLSGLQKKYVHDTDTLKKHVSTLQRKLQDACK
ncbi:MAG: hypothetical protein P4L16_04540 [Chlamydiales bacterium]|nr:hypothetical protein [Chlamydiales bacterium]